jgi:hypothetical protein
MAICTNSTQEDVHKRTTVSLSHRHDNRAAGHCQCPAAMCTLPSAQKDNKGSTQGASSQPQPAALASSVQMAIYLYLLNTAKALRLLSPHTQAASCQQQPASQR